MLRDYATTENWRLIDRALECFIDLPDRLSLVGFIKLSPDSFLWKIFDGKTVYYLYAEDHVPSLEHVKERVINFMGEFTPEKLELEFVPAKIPLSFEDSTPNKVATTYKPPADEYVFARYCAQSGYDFVFLLKSNEDLEDYLPAAEY